LRGAHQPLRKVTKKTKNVESFSALGSKYKFIVVARLFSRDRKLGRKGIIFKHLKNLGSLKKVLSIYGVK
jgi:hypothetical protein